MADWVVSGIGVVSAVIGGGSGIGLGGVTGIIVYNQFWFLWMNRDGIYLVTARSSILTKYLLNWQTWPKQNDLYGFP